MNTTSLWMFTLFSYLEQYSYAGRLSAADT